jgi:hypothetical protein
MNNIEEFEEAELVEEKELPKPEKRLPAIESNRREKVLKIVLLVLIIVLLIVLIT